MYFKISTDLNVNVNVSVNLLARFSELCGTFFIEKRAAAAAAVADPVLFQKGVFKEELTFHTGCSVILSLLFFFNKSLVKLYIYSHFESTLINISDFSC